MTKLILLDTCLPDYFLGYSGAVYAVPVDGNTTFSELMADIRNDWGNYDPDYSNIKTSEQLDAALADLFSRVTDMDAKAFRDLEPYSEDQFESVYAYFGETE